MKILHLSSGNLYGGVETLLTTLARQRHLVPEMEPEFGLCFHGRQWDELAVAGVPVHDLGPVRASRPWTVLRARRRLRQVLASTRPDAVITHSPWPHAVFAPVVRRAGVRLVCAIHNPTEGRHWVERWAARTPPDLVIANSQYTAGSIGNIFPGVETQVVFYPVAPPPAVDRGTARSTVRSEFGTPNERVVILQVSRMEWWKGQSVLLDALVQLKTNPSWECWIAGGAQRPAEAEYLASLKASAERGGIADRVQFLGQRSDVPQLMAAADVFCQPNAGPEPFGIVFVEALYAGLPVVTSAFGGAVEIVDETCGILTPPGDVAAVAEALAGLIRDPERRRKLGTAGPERAKELCGSERQLAFMLNTFGEGC